MITSFAYKPQLQIKVAPMTASKGLSRVFAAAVVNNQFRDLLLENPREALVKGYLGETFSLTPEESDLIASIRADSLSDLAKQVCGSMSIGD
ncbi:MAG: hypothetical protein L6Q49_11250 [Anaerolineales bacterium]|nr:hypothetical protein [Chloroflexi bacterium CFX2]MCK6583663.1 hypothetical protein [Anaerolineales bacterium]